MIKNEDPAKAFYAAYYCITLLKLILCIEIDYKIFFVLIICDINFAIHCYQEKIYL